MRKGLAHFKLDRKIMCTIWVMTTLVAILAAFAGCSNGGGTTSSTPANSTVDSQPPAEEKQPVTLTLAAAASLERTFVEGLIPMFQEQYDWISVIGTYDSSGKLQTQIEEGLEADLFVSAATRQMNALDSGGFMDSGSIVELLENKVVLIRGSSTDTDISGFEEVLEAEHIAVGDPDSVPAGQYAREIFQSLELWDQVEQKASLGTNVTEVLNWVAMGSADVGVVYATDAASMPNDVIVIAIAPEGSLAQRVIYPAGITAVSPNPEEARLFLDFLMSDAALAVFQDYGFSPA